MLRVLIAAIAAAILSGMSAAALAQTFTLPTHTCNSGGGVTSISNAASSVVIPTSGCSGLLAELPNGGSASDFVVKAGSTVITPVSFGSTTPITAISNGDTITVDYVGSSTTAVSFYVSLYQGTSGPADQTYSFSNLVAGSSSSSSSSGPTEPVPALPFFALLALGSLLGLLGLRKFKA